MGLIYDTEFPPQPQKPNIPTPKPLAEFFVGIKIGPIAPCTKCKGDGHSLFKGFITETGKKYSSRWDICSYCNGVGWFHAPDPETIFKSVKGRNPKKLRSKRPNDPRSYYVWRLARFHGGADVCLPMGAEMEIAGDPYKQILEILSRSVARTVYGSGNVGTARWHQAIYGSHNFEDLPTVLDGPVYDGDKPPEEILETV